MVDSRYPLIPMGNFLRLRKDFFEIDDADEYQLVTVQLHARGIKERSRLTGVKIKTKRQQRIKTCDLLVAEIDAKVGGFGIVPADLEGAIVSSHYFLYDVDAKQVNLRYLEYYLKSGHPEQDVGQFVKGSVNYAAIRPYHFPQLTIPLPPLDEQRRIVARIEALVGRIESAHLLMQEATNEVDALAGSYITQVFSSQPWKMISIDELIGREKLKNGKSLKANEQKSEVSCLRISALRNGKIDCSDTKPINMTLEMAKPYRVHVNDVFVVRGNGSKDLVGRAGLVEKCEKAIIFPDLFIKIPLDTTRVLPEFFVAWWNCPIMRETIVNLAKTTAGIWKVNQGHIASCLIPIPPIDEQRLIISRLDNLLIRVNGLRLLQSDTCHIMEALLPTVLDRAFRGEL